MTKGLVCFLLLLSLAGCAAPAQKFVKTDSQYIYSKVLVMPFAKGDEEIRALAYDVFVKELSSFNDVAVLDKDQLNDELFKDPDLSPQKQYTLDQFNSPEGSRRLKSIDSILGAKAIVLGTVSIDKDMAYLFIEMLNVGSDALTLSFSKQEEIINNDVDSAVRAVAKLCADKVISHIKDNVTITNIYKYQ